MLLDSLETSVSCSGHDQSVPLSVMNLLQDYSYPNSSEEMNVGGSTCPLNIKTQVELTEDIAEIIEEIEIEDANTESQNINENNENNLLYDEAKITVRESVYPHTLSVYPHRASLKNMPATLGIEPATFGILAQYSAS